MYKEFWGGMGQDDDLTAFGDTIYTINYMKSLKKPKLEYQLIISSNVQINAMKLFFDYTGYNTSLEKIGLNKKERKELINFLKKKPIFSEWDLIKYLYPEIKILEREEQNTYRNGIIQLENPSHLIVANNLTVI